MKLDIITNKGEVTREVNTNDEYYVPLYAILPIIKYIPKGSKIWCPFDTDESAYVKTFKYFGYDVINTHVSMEQDFFNIEVPDCDYIVSNPPYSLKTEVLKKLFEINKPFAMLIGVIGIFESKNRFNMFKNNKFEVMYFDKRVSYFKSYQEEKPLLNPPFSSVYICKDVLPSQIVFEELDKKVLK